jgi:hypothetical protein
MQHVMVIVPIDAEMVIMMAITPSLNASSRFFSILFPP